MTNPLTDARGALAAALSEGGLKAYTTPPEIPEGDDGPDDALLPYPLCYVVPAEPYLDFNAEGLMYGEALLLCNVSVVAASGASDVEAEQLDEELLKARAVLAGIPDWTPRQFLQPGRIVINNAVHLACAIEVSTVVTLEG